MFDGYPLTLGLWDTAGQEDYDRLRPLTYPQTDCFLVCFSLDSPASLENVRNKWYPEISHHAPGVPFVLVGTNLELRQQAEKTSYSSGFVQHAEGLSFAKQINASGYYEVSARTRENLKKPFDGAIRSFLMRSQNNPLRKEWKSICLNFRLEEMKKMLQMAPYMLNVVSVFRIFYR
jgi:Ras-related C3 botulinum toxin substrate 1